MYHERGHHHDFLSLTQQLAAPGELRTAQAFDFEFRNIEKQYESYHGINVKLRSVHLSQLSHTHKHRAELRHVSRTGT